MQGDSPRKLAFRGWVASVWLALTGLLPAQTPADPNLGLRLSLDPLTGVYTLSWYGVAGQTYFLQQSGDLLDWTYLPDIEAGADQPLQVGVNSPAARLFLRLRATNIPTADPYHDDFNGDGLSNWQNLLQGTDPLGPVQFDTNGLPLNWEAFYGVPAGTNPNALAPRGDGLTYLQAFQQGVNPDDFYNGSLPTLALLGGGNQRGSPGTVLPQPITVIVNSSGAYNAPLAFTVTSGSALLASGSSSGHAPSASMEVRSINQFPNALGNLTYVAQA